MLSLDLKDCTYLKFNFDNYVPYFQPSGRKPPEETPTLPEVLIEKLFSEESDTSLDGFTLTEIEKTFYKENVLVNKELAIRICNLTV